MMKRILLFSLSPTRAVRPRSSASVIASALSLSSSLHQLRLHSTSTSTSSSTRHSYGHGHGHGHGHYAAFLGWRWCRAAAPVRSYSTSKGSSGANSNASKAMRDFTQSKGRITERDAVEFMNNHRRSMKARDATNWVHAIAKKKIRLPDDIIVALIEILQQNQQMKVDHIYLSKCFQGLRCFRTPTNCAIVESYLVYLQRIMQNSSSSIKLDGQSVGQCLYALQGISSTQRGLSSLLCTLTSKINETKEMLNAQNISNALYGLQGMSSGEAEVRGVLMALSKKIGESREMLDAQAIGNALYGLKGMSSEEAEVRGVLKALSRKIGESREMLSAQNIGNALYGLQGMSSWDAEVRGVLGALSRKIGESQEMMDAQNIGNALYGLQGMSSAEVEVRGVLTALSRKIGQSQEILSGQEIGNALYGLQGMSSGDAEVRGVLEALSRKIRESREMLNAQNIGNALYGLQSMSSAEKEVRGVLEALSRKIGESREMLSGQEIGNALYGLQGMSSWDAEVRGVLEALSRKIGESWEMLDTQAIGNALYGLFNLLLCEVTDEVSVPLFKRVSEVVDVLLDGNADREISVFELRDMLRALKLAMHYFGDKGVIPDQAQRVDRLQRLLERMGGDEAEKKAFGSLTEERFYHCIQSILTSSRHHSAQYEVSHNEFLDSCFEADIIIRTVVGKDKPAVVYNIEIDGPSHLQPKTKRLCGYRDEYLKNACGIQIARIPLGLRRLQSESNVEIEAMARRALQALNILDGESDEVEGQ